MEHHRSAKRRRLGKGIEPCVQGTIEHGSMSILSLDDQDTRYRHISHPIERSSHTHLQTRYSAAGFSTTFSLLNQSNTQTFQARDLIPNATPNSRATVPSPHSDLSSDDGFQSCEDETQGPNEFTASHANTEQSVMVCFGMVG